MIKHFSHQQIDKNKWDHCIKLSPNSTIYAYSWYLDAICDQWDALVLDDYQAVMPLPWKKKLGFKYLYTPFFMQQLGVFSISFPDQLLISNFLDQIPKSFKYINLFLNQGNYAVASLSNIKPRPNYVLNLDKPYIQLVSDYKTNCKRNIKKALAAGLYIRSVSPNEVITLYRNNYEHISSACKENDYQKFERLVDHIQKQNNAEVWGVFQEQNLSAAGIFLCNKSTIYYLMGAGNTLGKQNGAFHFLMDQIIKKYAGSNYKLDFEGSILPSLANFYRQFGSVKTTYYHYQKNRLPFLLRLIKK